MTFLRFTYLAFGDPLNAVNPRTLLGETRIFADPANPLHAMQLSHIHGCLEVVLLSGGTECCWRDIERFGRGGWAAGSNDVWTEIPEADLTDEDWAALAVWRLTQ